MERKVSSEAGRQQRLERLLRDWIATQVERLGGVRRERDLLAWMVLRCCYDDASISLGVGKDNFQREIIGAAARYMRDRLPSRVQSAIFEIAFTGGPSYGFEVCRSDVVADPTHPDANLPVGCRLWATDEPAPSPPPVHNSGDFSIGSKVWPGTAKVLEEMGELQQVLGKLIAVRGASQHWDGDLRKKLVEETADVAAAVVFFVRENFTGDELRAYNERMDVKLARFRKWHADPTEPPMWDQKGSSKS